MFKLPEIVGGSGLIEVTHAIVDLSLATMGGIIALWEAAMPWV